MTGEYKVVSTEQLRRALMMGVRHDFTLRLDEVTLDRLDPQGHHSLGRLATDRGDRAHGGVPYYRVRALLALNGRLEPADRVVDVPVVLWQGWEDADAVIARLKDAIQLLGSVPVELREDAI